MPKYYCKAGSFRQIIDSPDIDNAADDFVHRAIKQQVELGFLIKISEMGFQSTDFKLTPTIPIMRRAGVELLPEHKLIDLVCKILKKDPKTIGDDAKKWLFGNDNK